jgi:membrane protease YdiL (CAAX protease family)
LLASLIAIPLLLLSALLPSGLPQGLRSAHYPWRGLGHVLDEHVLPSEPVRYARVVTLPNGDEIEVVRSTHSLGSEVLIAILYLVLGALALGLLRRTRPSLLRVESWRGTGLDLLNAVSFLLPPLLLGGVVLAIVAAGLDGGRPLVRAVHTFVQPLLAEPTRAPWFALRLVLLAPLAEELLWRGVVYSGLRQRLPPAAAAVVSSLAFAAWHLCSGWTQPYALVIQYVFGIAACWLVERTRSLWAGFLLHALGNLGALTLYTLCMFAPGHVLGVFGH